MPSSTVQQGPISTATRPRDDRGHFITADGETVIDVTAIASPTTRTPARGQTRKRAPSKPAPAPDPAPAVVAVAAKPAPAAKRTFVFYHGASAGYRWLLPESLRERTQMGYVEFRPDGFSREGTRIERGKYVTADAEIAKALREAIAAKRLRGVWEDDAHLRLRCAYCEFTAANNEQGRREMQAHNQTAHDQI